MDLSKLSDADLMAIQANDMAKVSDVGLQMLSGAPAAAPAKQNSIIDGITGALPSALLGAAKPFYGANQLAWQALGKIEPSWANKGDWPVEMLNKRQAQLNAEAGPTVSKFTTEPAALLGENILPTAAANKMVSAAGALPSFLKSLGANSVLGGATAYVNPEKTGLSQAEFANEKAKSTALGMAIPAGLSTAGKAITGTISPLVGDKARKLLDMGVELTPGQKMGGVLKLVEDKLTSYPVIGGMIEAGRKNSIESFDKAAFKKVLAPIGGQVPKVTGREGMDIVEQQVKHAYNELTPRLNFKATPDFNANMMELKGMAQNLPHKLGETFTNNIDQIIGKRLSKTGHMDGVDFKDAESELSKLTKQYSSSSTASEQNLGDAFKQALVNFRTTLAETNPQVAKELSDVNKSFANLSIVRKAASMANTQDRFTPSQLANAVKMADTSAGRNKTATGKALMQDLTDPGVSVLPSAVPDSGTAGRLNNTSPFAWAGGTLASIPYALSKIAVADRPKVMNKLAEAIRGTSPYTVGPVVNKSLGE